MFKMVVLSRLGEVAGDTCTVGGTVRYRIYFSNTLLIQNNFVITDRLDESLSKVTVFNGGEYDPKYHTITWKLPGMHRKPGSFVEFEATLTAVKKVCNQATARDMLIGRRIRRTNVVEINVVAPPPLAWIPLLPDANREEPPRRYMKDETTTGMTLRFDLPGMYVYEKVANGVKYHRLVLPGCSTLPEAGSPEVPFIGELIEVPFDVNFSVEIIETESKVFEGYNLYPSQLPIIVSTSFAKPFVENKNAYLANSNYPTALAIADTRDISVVRGHRLLRLKINPFQYNPAAKQLTAFTMIEVRLTYSHPAQVHGVKERLKSTVFEDLLKASVLNYKDPRRFQVEGGGKGGGSENGCHYLIITSNDFYNDQDPNNPVLRFAIWKRRKGYITRVVTVESIPGGNDPNSIRNYVNYAYDHWDPAPGYILLIGDAARIKPYPGMRHPDESTFSWALQPPIESDLFYATPQGGNIPSILIGRLSADKLQQVTDVIDKWIDYEQDPPALDVFYTHMTQVGQFSDVDGINNPGETPDAKENLWFIAAHESLREEMKNNYHVERIYSTNGNLPQKYEDGTDIPSDLRYPAYAWNGKTQDITNAINAGRFLMTYFAHGAPSGWGDPGFSSNEIGSLTNGNLTPVVFSMACQTGWYDNETDDDTIGGRQASADCFAEMFLRQPRGGAVGIVAMERIAYAVPVTYAMFGMYKAMWPDIHPEPNWSDYEETDIQPVLLPRLGQIFTFGKIYMEKSDGSGDIRQATHQMEHLFGDPEMPVWTRIPGRLNVLHPRSIHAAGQQQFTVKLLDADSGQPVQNANVVLSRQRGKMLLWMEQTHPDGTARFAINNMDPSDIEITVTMLGYRPYMGSMTINTAVLNRVEPAEGFAGDLVHIGATGFRPNQEIEIYLEDRLLPELAVADANGEFGQGTTPFDIIIPSDFPASYTNITARGKNSTLWGTAGFLVREKEIVDLWTYDAHEPSTWTTFPGDHPNWESPDIQLCNQHGDAVASDNLTVGETYTVNMLIRNKEVFPAIKANVVFKWCNYGAGGPWELLPPSDANKNVSVPQNPPGVAFVTTSFTPIITGHVCLLAEIEHINDINMGNNQGQENLHVGDCGSPSEVEFTVWNLTDRPAPVHLEVRQMVDRSQQTPDRLWLTSIKHPKPQILPPGEKALVSIIIDPDIAEATPGTQARFAVTAFIGHKMVGGINLLMTKK